MCCDPNWWCSREPADMGGETEQLKLQPMAPDLLYHSFTLLRSEPSTNYKMGFSSSSAALTYGHSLFAHHMHQNQALLVLYCVEGQVLVLEPACNLVPLKHPAVFAKGCQLLLAGAFWASFWEMQPRGQKSRQTPGVRYMRRGKIPTRVQCAVVSGYHSHRLYGQAISVFLVVLHAQKIYLVDIEATSLKIQYD